MKKLSQNTDPRLKCERRYLAKFVKNNIEKEEVFNKWIQSGMLYNKDIIDCHIMEKLVSIFKTKAEVKIENNNTKDIQASSMVEIPEMRRGMGQR